MKISVNFSTDAQRNLFGDSIVDYVSNALNRFSQRITTVTVTITDENGPRGGVDQQCRISVVMPRFGKMSASSRDETLWAALTQATEKSRRIVVDKLKRRQALRTRNAKERLVLMESPAEAIEI